MAQPILATPKLSDEATIAAVGSETGSMPASYLQRSQPSDRWRATDTGQVWIEFDLGSAQEVRALALLYSNAASDTTIRWRGDASQAGLTGTPAYDSTALSYWPGVDDLSGWEFTHSFLWLATSQTLRWWRVDISPGASLSYFEAGRVYIANPFDPQLGVEFGATFPSFDEDTSISEADGGAEFAENRPLRRSSELTFFSDSEEEMVRFEELVRQRGTSRDVLMVFDRESTHLHYGMICGRLESGPRVQVPSYQTWQMRASLREMR